MNWLSASERLAAIDRSTVSFTRSRCLHSKDMFSGCTACFDVCPTEAIQPGKPPSFDEKACANCFECLSVCPLDAYIADDEVAALLTCAARIDKRCIDLACGRHPRAEKGPQSAGLTIQIHGCLAGLGAGSYLALAALGIEHINVRLDACSGCEWSSLKEKIRNQVAKAVYFLDNLGHEDKVAILDKLEKQEYAERPVWDAHNPPLSRRDLFRFASLQSQVAAARALFLEQGESKQKPGKDHQRTRAALLRLVSEPYDDFSLAGMGFASIAISTSCTACRACVRSCPTGALQYEQDDSNHFRLLLNPQICVGCEICQHLCAPGAVRIDHSPSLRDVFGVEQVCLVEGNLTRCERCNSLYVSQPESKLCPVCEFRKQNPFGSFLSAGQNNQVVCKRKSKSS